MTPRPLGAVADAFQETVFTGPLLLALPVAAIAGLVSFLSPCVLPLVPGYLSYITGLSAADLADGDRDADPAGPPRGRVLLGGVLFVLGFSLVFVSYGAIFGAVGVALRNHQETLIRVFGGLTIVLGLVFAGIFGRLPFLQRDMRFHHVPVTGLAGAPLLGVAFGLGWAPCIGPTLAAVLNLALTVEGAARGGVLSFAYCLGLGAPFILTGLAFRRSMAAFAIVKRHYTLVMRVGGGFLVLIGILQVTGVYSQILSELQTWYVGFTPAV